jgi:hypothetical protein
MHRLLVALQLTKFAASIRQEILFAGRIPQTQRHKLQ